MAETEIAPGAVLGAERYTLTRWLGSGGMASVWLATDELLMRAVAVKVMADTLAFDVRYRERFVREARAAASVSHANIVPIYDYGLHGERPFLVMEHVGGGSLADVLAGRVQGAPDPVELARELLGALECVHGAGLVHRDVKPANILLDASGHARLTDFGIAQPDDATSLTQTGMVIGSVRYLAPEVAAGGRATVAADLYAAGVVLRELCRASPAPGLSGLVAALTASAPEDRPVSAAAGLEQIGVDSAVVPAPVADTRVAVPRPATRRTRVAAARPATPRTRVAAVRRSPTNGAASLAIHVSRRSVGLAVAALAVVVVVFLVASAGGSRSPAGAGSATSTGGPAAAPARLADQLSALEKVVDRAAGR